MEDVKIQINDNDDNDDNDETFEYESLNNNDLKLQKKLMFETFIKDDNDNIFANEDEDEDINDTIDIDTTTIINNDNSKTINNDNFQIGPSISINNKDDNDDEEILTFENFNEDKKKRKRNNNNNKKKDKEEYEEIEFEYNVVELLKYNTSLLELQQLYKEMKQTTSQKQKCRILKKHSNCAKLLYYVYHPYWHYFVTSDRLKRIMGDEKNPQKFAKPCTLYWKTKKGEVGVPTEIYELLDLLKDRFITGNDAINMVIEFIKENRRFQNLIYEIIDKSLKFRCNVKTINSVFTGLIPQFSVALAQPYTDHIKRVDFEKDIWLASRKYDGVRLLIYIDENGTSHFRSREGNYFLTLKPLENQLKGFPKRNIILDGEVCIMEEDKENFKRIVSEIQRDGHVIISPKYHIFDYLTFDEFNKTKGERKYLERYNELQEIYKEICETNHYFSNYFTIVKQNIIKNDPHLKTLTDQAHKNGWEGLIMRKNIGYEGKRSNNMLKVKSFKEEEFICIGIESTKMRIVENAEEIEIETLGNIIIDIGDGNKVGVGSGFTIIERKRFFENPNLIIGKSITVSYFDRSIDKNNKPSLRFPTFRCVHKTEQRDI